MVVGGEVFGYRFGCISFVNVIQMLTETFCYHALGFTIYTASHFTQVMAYMTSLVVEVFKSRVSRTDFWLETGVSALKFVSQELKFSQN